MGWLSGTPKWYEKVIEMVNVLPDAYILDKHSINRLEDIRRSYNLSHDDFAEIYMGCKTVTRKVNLTVYDKIKNDSKPGTSEKDIIKQFLMIDLESCRSQLSDEDFIIVGRDFMKGIESVNTIEEAIKYIQSFDEKTDIPPFTYMRRIIDAVLGWV